MTTITIENTNSKLSSQRVNSIQEAIEILAESLDTVVLWPLDFEHLSPEQQRRVELAEKTDWKDLDDIR